MCCSCAIQALLNDPLIQLVMESDGVGQNEILAAFDAAASGNHGVPLHPSWWMVPRADPRAP